MSYWTLFTLNIHRNTCYLPTNGPQLTTSYTLLSVFFQHSWVRQPSSCPLKLTSAQYFSNVPFFSFPSASVLSPSFSNFSISYHSLCLLRFMRASTKFELQVTTDHQVRATRYHWPLLKVKSQGSLVRSANSALMIELQILLFISSGYIMLEFKENIWIHVAIKTETFQKWLLPKITNN